MSERKLIILGTSSQQPTRFRSHGAYLLLWNNEGMLFDPGEGTQRQFIYANVSPTTVNRIFISHFHGDHCLGLGSVLMRLNLDKVTHPIHCYYPESGKKYFDRLVNATIYHKTLQIIEHPVSDEGIVEDDGNFKIEAAFLEHGVDSIAWRITEADGRKFDQDKLNEHGIRGVAVKEIEENGFMMVDGKRIELDDVSWVRQGDVFVCIMDTLYCRNAVEIAKGATMLLSESTYLDEHREMAYSHKHMTAKQAALIAKEAGVGTLILTHFSARYLNVKEFESEARAVFPRSFAAEDLKVFPFEKSFRKVGS